MIFPHTRAVSERFEVVTEDFEVVTQWGAYTVYRGYWYDGASIPRIFQWLLRLNRFDPLVRAGALAHDYAYDKGNVSRKDADEIYRHYLKINGVDWTRRNLHYLALRAFGWIPWNKFRKAELKSP